MNRPIGSTTIRLAADLQARHAATSSRSLTVLRGGLAAEAGLLGLLEELRENNQQRLGRADGVDGRPASDRHMLETWLQVVRRLHGQEGRRRATRLLQKEADTGADLRTLGARFARHCGQQCSLTGVRVSAAAVRGAGKRSWTSCRGQVVNASRLQPPAPGASLAGAFTLSTDVVGSGAQIKLDLHNVLGHTRPLVPVFVQAVAELADGQTLPFGGEIFVYAEEVAAGTHRSLEFSATGLLDTLPCPAGLIRHARLYVWLPTGAGSAPGPVDRRQSTRLVA